MGRPKGSSAKGMSEPKGNPECFLESVDSVATEVSESRVRIRSAWLGSGSCGSVGPVGACWRGTLVSFDDIGFTTLSTFEARWGLPVTRHCKARPLWRVSTVGQIDNYRMPVAIINQISAPMLVHRDAAIFINGGPSLSEQLIIHQDGKGHRHIGAFFPLDT